MNEKIKRLIIIMNYNTHKAFKTECSGYGRTMKDVLTYAAKHAKDLGIYDSLNKNNK